MHYHIVGIAGAGMSAIASILLDQGHHVSGSDLEANRLTAALQARGATIHVGHHLSHVVGAEALLATAAVRPEHPELVAARRAGIPVLKRTDLWKEWSQQRPVIAIAGSHGKTTTTAMVAWVLHRAGLNPGFLIGSAPADLPSNACWGHPDAPLVIEADEYDYAFLSLTPDLAIVTVVDWDHPDLYPCEADYHTAFRMFASQVRRMVFTCGDTESNARWRVSLENSGERLRTYGFNEANDYRAVVIASEPEPPVSPTENAGTCFTVFKGGQRLGDRWGLTIPGRHNIQNALAAVAVADTLNLETGVVAQALRTFHGTARRFEQKGSVGGVTIIDDYAHHPTEVRATLAAARERYGSRRILVYLQPHTYSRTLALLEPWGAAFADADAVLIGDIYPSREVCPDDTTPETIVADLVARIAASHPDVNSAGSISAAIAAVRAKLREGDVFITLGAGDGYRIGEALLQDPELT
ncbi:MAG: UDP-N-acetylmuramate--L-alanine ligase [Chloroflexaceae bacterium]|nr:UDP-N-acetylmuramate--L-alanine ligase [Chloroflexaceae bacterium]